MFRRILLLALLAAAVHAQADDRLRSVQEELRRRNIYFGDIDGRETPELKEAVSRYQKRKGFTATGHGDPDTLRSLGLLPRTANEAPPKELEWPEEPVLKSDTAINVRAEARTIAQETGVFAASIAPDAAGKGRKGARAAARPASRSANGGGQQAAQKMQKVSPKIVEALVVSYLQALAGNDVRGELGLYADRVDYLGNGVIDRRIIEQTLQDYYRRWPSRKYSAVGNPRVSFVPKRGEIVVTMQVNFTLKNKRTSVRGRTENRFVINAGTSDPRISSIQERRIRG